MKLSDRDIARHVSEIREQGYSVVENAMDPSLRRNIKEALDRYIDTSGHGYAGTQFEGMNTIRIYNMLALDPAFQIIPIHENALPIAEGVLDEELQLSSLSAIILGPDQAAQPIHCDTQQINLPRPHPTIALNCMWAITEFTEANGATRIVPGSHKNANLPPYGEEVQTIAAEMPAGSAMFFDSALWHGGGHNTTNERRYGVSNYYCTGWMRQQENQQLGIPKDRLENFPRRLLELCGFSVYKGQYGHIANHDPIEIFGHERRGRMVWEASDIIKEIQHG
tara:strand:+ start:1570 stop:2409 length:840 start_codon:yes stop_codon:yes gene_type:complete